MNWPWSKERAKLDELVPPAPVVADPDGTEVLRVWIVSQRLRIAVRPMSVRTPDLHEAFVWGMALVDAARLLGDGIEEQGAGIATKATKSMRDGYDAHWANVSGKPDAAAAVVAPAAKGSLALPLGAGEHSKSIELIRIWSVRGGLVYVLRPSAFPDPRVWGMLLCDLARALALSCEMTGRGTFEDAVRNVRAGFEAEWSRPTDTPRKFAG